MKVLSAIGARPQFIKAAPVSAALRDAGIDELIVNSGQHYDHDMSQVFFDELGIPAPGRNLGVGSGPHGKQTGAMMEAFEAAMIEYAPDWVIVHGDTNSTLAAAIAAVKLQIKVAHNEAGLRSFNKTMPEEHNRVLTDHCSDLLFAPTQSAVDQLELEGLTRGVHNVGDVMYDASLRFSRIADEKSRILDTLNLDPGEFVLATLHRPYNVDIPGRLQAIFNGLAMSSVQTVLPCHPRLVGQLKKQGLEIPEQVTLIDPVGYLDMITLERNARLILTDSGGVQKEAYFWGVPCITVRPETEWTETVDAGWNLLADADEKKIALGLTTSWWPDSQKPLFGDGKAAERIAAIILK